MKYKNVYDMHTHSVLSFDGNDTCFELCEAALSNGAAGIAVTDHCDIDGVSFNALVFCKRQFDEVKKAKEKYFGKLQVFQGLEIGQGIYRKELTQKVLDTFEYDFVLGSLHNLENMEDFYFLNYNDYDINSLLMKYFEGLYELCQWGAFDSLAHLTYPLRYIPAAKGTKFNSSPFSEITDAIFEKLVNDGKALEINTSGLFMDMRDTLPSKDYIKRFKQAGGKFITIGSDSHYASKICQGIEAGMKLAYECGFREFTVFKGRQPELITIE